VNKKMKQLNKNQYDSLKKLDASFNITLNCLKINVHNKLEHELAKFFVLWELLKDNKIAVSEAVFTNGKRTDIYDLNSCSAVEVVNSETFESMKKKKETYPCEVLFLKSEDILKFWKQRLFK